MISNLTNVAYVHMRHIYNPPEDGIHEPTKNEWLRVPVSVTVLSSKQTSIVFPNANIRFACDAIILDDGSILKFLGLPDSYKNKKCDEQTLQRLEELAWDTRKTRCKDCPEYPWAELMDQETISMRIEDAYGTTERMNQFFKSSSAGAYNADLYEIRKRVMFKPHAHL